MDISARGRAAPRRRTPASGKLKITNANTHGNGAGNGDASTPELDLKKLLRALQAVRDGDFSARLAPDQTGLAGKIADTFNELVSCNERLAHELERAGSWSARKARRAYVSAASVAAANGARWSLRSAR